MNTVGGRELRSLLELLAIWFCHIWLVVRIKFASLAANLSLGQRNKGAKIRNRYNQVPHLTKDTNEKVTKSHIDTTNESQEVRTF